MISSLFLNKLNAYSQVETNLSCLLMVQCLVVTVLYDDMIDVDYEMIYLFFSHIYRGDILSFSFFFPETLIPYISHRSQAPYPPCPMIDFKNFRAGVSQIKL